MKVLALLADGLNQVQSRKANYDLVLMLRLFESLEHMALDKNYRFSPEEVFGLMQKLDRIETSVTASDGPPPSLPAPA